MAAERSVEIEKKFDVEAGTPVPDWTRVPGVASVSEAEERHLDAGYLDTADARLAKFGVAVRRRVGGHDAGWHIKGPLVNGGRVELGWPLTDDVPDELMAEISQWTDERLSPLARIVNDRTAYNLLNENGEVVAEFVNDRVKASDLRRGVDREWCEWEIELGPAAPEDHDAFFEQIEKIALEAGATKPSSASKLARALGR